MLDLDMAPYAAFVWPAWGVSALVLAAAGRYLAGAAVVDLLSEQAQLSLLVVHPHSAQA